MKGTLLKLAAQTFRAQGALEGWQADPALYAAGGRFVGPGPCSPAELHEVCICAIASRRTALEVTWLLIRSPGRVAMAG